jgi:transposase
MGRRCNLLTQELEDIVNTELSKLKKRSKFDSVREKLTIIKAVINIKSISIVAQIHSMKPATISLWIKKLLKSKTADVLKKNHPGAQKKLSPDQWQTVLKWVQNDSQLSCSALKVKVKAEYNIDIHIETIRQNLIKLGYSFITPRPQHPQQDIKKTEEFKKN